MGARNKNKGVNTTMNNIEERYIATFGDVGYMYWLARNYPAQYNYFNKHREAMNSILAEYEARITEVKKREEALTSPQETEYKIDFDEAEARKALDEFLKRYFKQ